MLDIYSWPQKLTCRRGAFWRTVLQWGPNYFKSAATFKTQLITWIPPVVLVKLEFVVIFTSNLPRPVVFAVLSRLFLKLENKAEMVLRLKKHGPLDGRHHLLSATEVPASVAFLSGRCPSIVTQVDPGFCFTHRVHI